MTLGFECHGPDPPIFPLFSEGYGRPSGPCLRPARGIFQTINHLVCLLRHMAYATAYIGLHPHASDGIA